MYVPGAASEPLADGRAAALDGGAVAVPVCKAGTRPLGALPAEASAAPGNAVPAVPLAELEGASAEEGSDAPRVGAALPHAQTSAVTNVVKAAAEAVEANRALTALSLPRCQRT